jgi:hypothetical protein
MPEQEEILLEIAIERAKQDLKWGPQHHKDGVGGSHLEEAEKEARAWCEARANAGTLTWRDILFEEVTEAFAAATVADLREELLQTCAVAVAWIEDIDSREEASDGGSDDPGTDAPGEDADAD